MPKSITVLKFKVTDVSPRIIEAALLCREARNVASEDWMLRQRGKPETPCQAKRNRKGNELTESTKLYHAITSAVPQIGTDVASNIAQQVNSFLGAKVDWRKCSENGNGNGNGKKPKRRDAILVREERSPFYTDMSVPIANKYVTIQFDNSVHVHVSNVMRNGKTQMPLDFELSLKGMPAGKKKMLRALTNGDKKLADSKLLERRGKWYWYIPVTFESIQLDENRVATLKPVIGERSPRDGFFQLSIPGRPRPWYVGCGGYLLAQTQRLIGLRKQIGWRYRQRMGAGHGRRKVDGAISKRNRQLADIRTEVRRRAIVDIIRQCERAQCGTLEYFEPTNPAKTKCWFAENGLEFDWTRWVTDLKNSCAGRGIVVKVRKLKMAEIAESAAA